MIDFIPVEDMTKAELRRELNWVEHEHSNGEFDIVLMYRLEELEQELSMREEE